MPAAPLEAAGRVSPSREIKSLTGLRGVAALYVVFHHYFQSTEGFKPFAYTVRGYLSVDLFFVLSGFVLTLTYRDRLTAGSFNLRAYGEFIYTRLGRIYPLYFFVLVLLLGLVAMGVGARATPADILANLLLVQAWGGPTHSINGPGWSISTEFFAYLVFPFLASLVLSRSRAALCLVVALAVAFLGFAATRTDEQLGFAWRLGPLDVYSGTIGVLLRCLGGFALGVVACRLAGSAAVRRVMGLRGVAEAMVVVVIAAWRFPALDVVTVVLFVPLVLALSQERSVASRVLGWGGVYRLGVISYSVYLLHAPLGLLRQPLEHFLRGFAVPKANTVSGFLLVAFLVVLAEISFRAIEHPAREFARRSLKRWRRSDAVLTTGIGPNR